MQEDVPLPACLAAKHLSSTNLWMCIRQVAPLPRWIGMPHAQDQNHLLHAICSGGSTYGSTMKRVEGYGWYERYETV